MFSSRSSSVSFEPSPVHWQVQEHTERPVGMALYEMKNGQISNICIQGGECCCSTTTVANGARHLTERRARDFVSGVVLQHDNIGYRLLFRPQG